jgi:hypothetical protein
MPKNVLRSLSNEDFFNVASLFGMRAAQTVGDLSGCQQTNVERPSCEGMDQPPSRTSCKR